MPFPFRPNSQPHKGFPFPLLSFLGNVLRPAPTLLNSRRARCLPILSPNPYRACPRTGGTRECDSICVSPLPVLLWLPSEDVDLGPPKLPLRRSRSFPLNSLSPQEGPFNWRITTGSRTSGPFWCLRTALGFPMHCPFRWRRQTGMSRRYGSFPPTLRQLRGMSCTRVRKCRVPPGLKTGVSVTRLGGLGPSIRTIRPPGRAPKLSQPILNTRAQTGSGLRPSKTCPRRRSRPRPFPPSRRATKSGSRGSSSIGSTSSGTVRLFRPRTPRRTHRVRSSSPPSRGAPQWRGTSQWRGTP